MSRIQCKIIQHKQSQKKSQSQEEMDQAKPQNETDVRTNRQGFQNGYYNYPQ